MKRNLIVLLACLVTQIAMGEPSLAEKNAAENAAIKKEWESWNAPFQHFAHQEHPLRRAYLDTAPGTPPSGGSNVANHTAAA